MTRWTTLFTVLLLLAPRAWAQATDPLDAGIAAYDRSDYAEAERQLQQALAESTNYQPERRAEIHRYMAMTDLAYNRVEPARAQFVLALKFNPNLSFDEALTSPKILRVFHEAQAMANTPTQTTSPDNSTKGQETEKTRDDHQAWKRPVGWTLVGVGGASLLTSAVTYGLVWDTHAKYEDENSSQSKADSLKKQGLQYETISGVTLVAGAVFVGTGLYFLLTDHRAADEPRTSWFVVPQRSGAALGVVRRF